MRPTAEELATKMYMIVQSFVQMFRVQQQHYVSTQLAPLLTLHMYVSTTIDIGILTKIANCQHTMPINIEYLCVVKFVNCSVGRDRVGRFVTTGMN